MIFKKLLFLFVALVLCFSGQAHSRTEIGIKILEEDNGTYLEVHLTSLTLFDLVYDMHPELESQASLNLSHFAADYQTYFNHNIDLELNSKRQKLIYAESNLITHDASVKFLIQNFDEQISSYNITVGGFEFYKKPSFTVVLATTAVTKTCFLNKVDNSCVGAKNRPVDQNLASEVSPNGLAMILTLALITAWGLRKRLSKQGI